MRGAKQPFVAGFVRLEGAAIVQDHHAIGQIRQFAAAERVDEVSQDLHDADSSGSASECPSS